MMNRRHFVRLSAGAAAGGLLGLEHVSFLAKAEAAQSSLDRIGVQLYTVRTLLENDFEGTMAAVADIGFHEVEFHDYFGREPQQVRELLTDLGLDAPASHFPSESLRDDPEGVIETALAIGHRYVILAWLPPEDRASIDQYADLAAFCNRMGKLAKSAGLRFAFHNHDFDLYPIEGTVPFDLLISETDPDLVDFELDLFWTTKAGHDPLDYFESHPGRFPLCHVKDMAEDQNMVEVGGGGIDFASIFAASNRAGLEYYFVEHDEPADPLASIRSSFEYLQTLRY